MNIQGSSIVEQRRQPQQGTRRNPAMILQVGALVILLVGIANTNIYLNQKITETDRAILKIRTELAGVEREIDSYRLQYETYSAWSYIGNAIRRFNLPLRQATPGQCRQLTMVPPSLAPAIAITFRDTALQQPVVAQAKAAPRALVPVQPKTARYPAAYSKSYRRFRFSRN